MGTSNLGVLGNMSQAGMNIVFEKNIFRLAIMAQ